jgi:uncharacterized protein (DUF2164 family)
MSQITFSKEETAQIAGELQHYFREELDQEIGALQAEMFLDFLSQTIGPAFYNRGLYDAQALLAAKLEDLTDAVLALEQPTRIGR